MNVELSITQNQTVDEYPDIAEEILLGQNINFEKLSYVSSDDFGLEQFSFIFRGRRYLLCYSLGIDSRVTSAVQFLLRNKHEATEALYRHGECEVYGEAVHFMIHEYDFAEPLCENFSYLTDRFNDFSESFKGLTQQNICVKNWLDYVHQLEDLWEIARKFINHPSYHWANTFMEDLFLRLKSSKPRTFKNNKNIICHGDLTADKIKTHPLFKGCKINNWKFCFNHHEFFDVCYFGISLGLNFEECKKFYASCFNLKPKKNFSAIYRRAQISFLAKNMTYFCYWSFSRKRVDGFDALSYSEKIKVCLNSKDLEDDELIKKIKPKIFSLVDDLVDVLE